MILLRKIKSEIIRIWPLLLIVGLALLVLGDTAQLAVQLYKLSMVALVLIAAHCIRKAMFPYLDMKAFVTESKGNPIACALVVLALLGLIAVIIAVASLP